MHGQGFLILIILARLEEHRDMLDNQILDLDEVAFAREGIEVAQYTVCFTNIN